MTIQRKHIPEPVIWDQTSILREIAKLRSQLAQLTNLTENPSSDTRATIVRNVRDYEILASMDRNTELLGRIEQHLSFISGVDLDEGETR